MSRGGFSGGFGGNFNSIMKQAEKMQKEAMKLQEDLESKTVETTSGGGAVKVVINGKKEMKEITINKDVVDPDDVEMLQDLIMTAVNEAIRQIDEYTSKEMERVTGGGIPGLPGLF